MGEGLWEEEKGLTPRTKAMAMVGCGSPQPHHHFWAAL